jgi:hypothetical protein
MGEASGMERNSKFEPTERDAFELASKFEFRISGFGGPKT